MTALLGEQTPVVNEPNLTNPHANEGFLFENPDQMPTVKIHGSVKVDGAKAAVPWTAEFPEQLTYDGLTLLIPGFGGIKRSSRDERHANAESGRAAISYDPARISSNFFESITNSQDLHTRTAEGIIFAVQDAISNNRSIPNRSQLNADRVVASVHSMGGYPGTELALRHPAMIESVIYKGAAGFWPLSVRDMRPLQLLQSVNKYIASGRIELSVHNLYRIIHYYARDPSRTLGEAGTCMTLNISDRVASLADHGVSTGYLAFENDELVPTAKARLKTQGKVGKFAVLAGVGHLAPQSHPEETSKATWDLQRKIQSTPTPTLRVVGGVTA